MNAFDRRLPERGIERLATCAEDFPWFRDLLLRWQPAGGGGPVGNPSLRLAIRNGYINFYRLGQSVAKVTFARDGSPRASIHSKYVDGVLNPDQRYIRLKAGSLSSAKDGVVGAYSGAAMLAGWIANAESKSGKEKSFVDDVLTATPNVIDLEMGLPAAAKGDNAPRMDIVAVEPVGTGWRIVFWEAKLMSDGRLRRSGTRTPEVVEQLSRYTEWMSKDGHTGRVVEAYRENCRLLVALHAIAKTVGADIAPLGEGIIAAADRSIKLDLDSKPRLLIKCPAPDTWVENHHTSKLQNIPIHLINPQSDYTLPVAV